MTRTRDQNIHKALPKLPQETQVYTIHAKVLLVVDRFAPGCETKGDAFFKNAHRLIRLSEGDHMRLANANAELMPARNRTYGKEIPVIEIQNIPLRNGRDGGTKRKPHYTEDVDIVIVCMHTDRQKFLHLMNDEILDELDVFLPDVSIAFILLPAGFSNPEATKEDSPLDMHMFANFRKTIDEDEAPWCSIASKAELDAAIACIVQAKCADA